MELSCGRSASSDGRVGHDGRFVVSPSRRMTNCIVRLNVKDLINVAVMYSKAKMPVMYKNGTASCEHSRLVRAPHQ